MNTQALSLDQAPPYTLVMSFFFLGVLYLTVSALLLLTLGIEHSSDYKAIALVHIATLGFFTHIMFGALLQMVPVMIGAAYKRVKIFAVAVLLLLNFGMWIFVAGFFLAESLLLLFAAILLFLAFALFSTVTMATIYKSVARDATALNFIFANTALLLGVALGTITLLGHAGINSYNMASLHINTLGFGWIFLLVSGVAYRIIPMFYVATDYPLWMRNTFGRVTLGALFILVALEFFAQLEAVMVLLKLVLALQGLLFAGVTIWRLYKRKRARSDTTVTLWYFSMVHLFGGCLLWSYTLVSQESFAFELVFLFGLGFGFALINAMLYKIVPFLTWFHLSATLVMRALMSDVIAPQVMRLQARLFFASYAFFVLTWFYAPLLTVALMLFVASLLLLHYALACGYRYHQSLIKEGMKI
jgi:hypothetical protein